MIDFDTVYDIERLAAFCCHDKDVAVAEEIIGGKRFTNVICSICKYCCFLRKGKVVMAQTIVNDVGIWVHVQGTVIGDDKRLNFPIINAPIELSTFYSDIERLLVLL